jgi:hypothetical protein
MRSIRGNGGQIGVVASQMFNWNTKFNNMKKDNLKTESNNTNLILSAGFFEELGFYETSPQPLYKLPLPTVGTYLLATNEGSLWIEYDEGNGEHYKQSVGFGKFTKDSIIILVSVLQTCR